MLSAESGAPGTASFVVETSVVVDSSAPRANPVRAVTMQKQRTGVRRFKRIDIVRDRISSQLGVYEQSEPNSHKNQTLLEESSFFRAAHFIIPAKSGFPEFAGRKLNS
jgi:hypothetical protein